MKTLTVYKRGSLEITAKVPDEDYEWFYALFTRNSKPFKALKDFGYVPEEDYGNKKPSEH